MGLRQRVDNYLTDKKYVITYEENQVNVNNYIEILDFSPAVVSIKHNKGITKIKGKDLVVSKMLDNEVLIIGNIKQIDLK